MKKIIKGIMLATGITEREKITFRRIIGQEMPLSYETSVFQREAGIECLGICYSVE
jgi:hypothetical protein